MSEEWPWGAMSNWPTRENPSIAVDILAKRWRPHNDSFEFCRFIECKWDHNSKVFMTRTGESLLSLGWYPVGYMKLPPLGFFPILKAVAA